MKKDVRNLESLLLCNGFQPGYLNDRTPISISGILPDELRQALPQVQGNNSGELKYSMLSVYYHRERKVPLLAAYNIDGTLPKKKVARLSAFRADPRIDPALQLDQDFYDLIRAPEPTEFEVGHMASHNEMSWGADATLQAHQTFFYTNSVPQVEKLNSGL